MELLFTCKVGRPTAKEGTMEDTGRAIGREQLETGTDWDVETQGKRPFTEPKLTFVAPKLVKRGTVEELTGFFGTFSP